MTVTERERRKDELLQCGVHRAELCVMVANLEYDLAQMTERHERLRRAVESAVRELTKEVVV